MAGLKFEDLKDSFGNGNSYLTSVALNRQLQIIRLREIPLESKKTNNEVREKTGRSVTFVCEHCSEPVHYEFLTPIAVRCDHCDSVFDARLQLIKKIGTREGKEDEGDSRKT